MTVAIVSPARRDVDARTPDLVDSRYRLVDVAGRGNRATVWRAFDERLGRTVAVKFFAHAVHDPARELTDLEVMARLSHPGLLTMFDGGVHAAPDDAPRTFVVTELVDGPDLGRALASGPTDTVAAAQVGVAVARGLAHLHAHGAVHRAVEPGNILIPSGESSLRPVDAKLAISRAPAHDRPPLGPHHDVFALARVLIVMLTGRSAGPDAVTDPRWAGLLRSMCDARPAYRPTAAQLVGVLTVLATTPRLRRSRRR